MPSMTRRRFIGTTGLAAVAPLGTTLSGMIPQNAGATRGSASIEKNIVFGKGGNTDISTWIFIGQRVEPKSGWPQSISMEAALPAAARTL